MPVRSRDTIYQTLPSATCIRLLSLDQLNGLNQLICSLELLDLKDAEGYTGYSALSYEWGDESIGGTIQVGGQCLDIRLNLWRFLLQALANGWTKHLWVDAICIDQDNILERNAQVSMMGEIYSRASNVLVWLGPLEREERQAINEMDRVYDRMEEYDRLGWRHDLKKGFSASAQSGFKTLAQKKYWKRKWVIQEVRLSGPNASLVYGDGQISLHRITKFLFKAQSCITPHDNWYKTHLGRLTNLLAGRESMTYKPTELGMLFTMYNHHQCGDPRDHIYALLGMASVNGFPIDYHIEVVDLYWAALSHVFKGCYFESARDLRGMAGSLRSIMGLTKGDLLTTLANSRSQGSMYDMLAFTFAEALKICLGGLASMPLDTDNDLTGDVSKLPVVRLDYTLVAKKVPVSGQRDGLDEPFSTILQHSQANCSFHSMAQGFSLTNYYFDIGNYFIGEVEDKPYHLGAEWKSVWELCNENRLNKFPVQDRGSHLGVDAEQMKFALSSPSNQVVLAGCSAFEAKDLMPLNPGDRICSFSDIQAAIAVRRISKRHAICGTAVVRRDLAGWHHGVGDKRNGTSPEQEANSTHYAVQFLMVPHSILDVSNWSTDVGIPIRPFREVCRCKPGEGGCR